MQARYSGAIVLEELALEMLTKLSTHFTADLFIAIYIVERCTTNESEPSLHHNFYLL